MVLDNPVPTEAARGCSWYMAEALLHGDPGKIVPVESLERVPPTLKAVAWKALGEFYPDQEIIWAVANRGVNPGMHPFLDVRGEPCIRSLRREASHPSVP